MSIAGSQPQRRPTTRDNVIAGACVVACGAILGLNFAILKAALRFAGPLVIQALATCLTGVVLGTYLLTRPTRARLNRGEFAWTASAGLLLGVCGSCLTAFGVQRIAAGNAALILATTPVLTVLVRVTLFRDRARSAEVLGCVIGLAGVGIIVWGEAQSGASQLLGGMLVLLSALMWALALIVTREHLGRVPPDVAVSWEMIVSSPVLVVVAFAGGRVAIPWTLSFLGAVAYLGLAGKGLSFLLQMIAVRRGSDVMASATAFVTPPFGVLFGALLLAEPIGAWEIAGAFVILSAVLAIGFGASARHGSEPGLIGQTSEA